MPPRSERGTAATRLLAAIGMILVYGAGLAAQQTSPPEGHTGAAHDGHGQGHAAPPAEEGHAFTLGGRRFECCRRFA